MSIKFNKKFHLFNRLTAGPKPMIGAGVVGGFIAFTGGILQAALFWLSGISYEKHMLLKYNDMKMEQELKLTELRANDTRTFAAHWYDDKKSEKGKLENSQEPSAIAEFIRKTFFSKNDEE